MFCGIDVGTQGVRAVVADSGGTVRGTGAAPLTAGTRTGREHTQMPDTWWTALTVAVRIALDAAQVGTVDAVALDGTSGTVLVEDRHGAPRGPALMYDDARAVDELAVVAQTGADLWEALGYRMQASWALPKAVWLVRSGAVGPDDRIVHQSDHVVGRLCGRRVATDTSNALKTGADLRDATWPTALHHDLGLPRGVFPDLVVPGTVLGAVGRDAAAATGLPEGIPVRAGMTDGCAAQIASGALAVGHWSSALGTTLVLKGSTRQLVKDPSGAVYSHRHPDGGWLPGGASSTGAGIIGETFGRADLAELTRRAATVDLGAAVTYPLAGRGERFPFVAPQARGFGVPDGDDAVRFAAICRGVAYVERLAYDVLGTLGADVTGPVSLTGGASRNAR